MTFVAPIRLSSNGGFLLHSYGIRFHRMLFPEVLIGIRLCSMRYLDFYRVLSFNPIILDIQFLLESGFHRGFDRNWIMIGVLELDWIKV